MRQLAITALLLSTAACHDGIHHGGSPTAPIPRAERTTSFPGDKGWLALSPADKDEAVRTFRRVYAADSAHYLRARAAVLEGELPGGARALIVQDPAAPEHPLLLLSRSSATERVFSIAVRAFADPGTSAGRSRIQITRSLEALFEGDRTSTPLSGAGARAGVEFERGAARDRIAAMAAAGELIEIPRLGRAKLLRIE